MFTVTQKEKSCCGQEECVEMAHHAGHKLRETVDSATSDMRDATAATIKHVRNQPVQSSLMALGIGFITGLLFRRR